MPEPVLRKLVSCVEEVFHEGGPRAEVPLQRASLVAVISNPFAGRFVAEIADFMEDLKPLGTFMARELVSLLGGEVSRIEGYGKGTIVGSDGEIEHGALWHAPGGYGMRQILGNPKAIVPSTKKVGDAGTRLDVPVTHINASYVRSHFDAIEVSVCDAPRRDEMCCVLAMTTGPRIHHRSLGLAAKDIKGEDGLR